MHAITPKASNTAIMFGTTRSHQSLLAILVFIARSPLIWKKCSHDFIGFSALKKSKKSTVRTIDEITITPEGDLLRFTFKGNGFLHKMVRILTGTLIAIGDGTLPPEVIDQVLADKVRQAAGETVPSHGLFLDEVYY